MPEAERRALQEERTSGGADSRRSVQLQGWIPKRAVSTFRRVIFNTKRSSLIAIINKLSYFTRIVRGQKEGGHPEEVELRTRKRIKKRGDEDEETNDPYK